MTTPPKTRHRRLRLAAISLLAALSAVCLSGCDPPLDPQEYGEILPEVPKVPGADQPYPLPQLDQAPAEGEEPL